MAIQNLQRMRTNMRDVVRYLENVLTEFDNGELSFESQEHASLIVPEVERENYIEIEFQRLRLLLLDMLPD